jgi:subtilase family serine protease
MTQYYLSTDTTKSSGDKLLTGTRSVPALGPGASSTGTLTVTVPTTTTLGTYYLLACADDSLGGAVAESNETNNCITSGTVVEIAP